MVWMVWMTRCWKISCKTSSQKGCCGALAMTALLTSRPESLGSAMLSHCHAEVCAFCAFCAVHLRRVCGLFSRSTVCTMFSWRHAWFQQTLAWKKAWYQSTKIIKDPQKLNSWSNFGGSLVSFAFIRQVPKVQLKYRAMVQQSPDPDSPMVRWPDGDVPHQVERPCEHSAQLVAEGQSIWPPPHRCLRRHRHMPNAVDKAKPCG